MGGPSPEYRVSLKTGQIIVKNLNPSKYNAVPIVISPSSHWYHWDDAHNDPEFWDKQEPNKKGIGASIDHMLFETGTEIVFVAMHGAYGEDGTVQGLLEALDVPYTGSGIVASALGMDKEKSRQIFRQRGLQTPPTVRCLYKAWQEDSKSVKDRILNEIGYPCVVKPNNLGSSLGVNIIHEPEELEECFERSFEFSDTLLVEKFLKGTEVTCAILGNPRSAEPLVLPPIEIIPEGEFFDYQNKYTPGRAMELIPARISKTAEERVMAAAVEAHSALGCAGMSRTDMILVDDVPMVLEINTIPGMTEVSLYPQSAKAVGIDFPSLLDRIIDNAMTNYKNRTKKYGKM